MSVSRRNNWHRSPLILGIELRNDLRLPSEHALGKPIRFVADDEGECSRRRNENRRRRDSGGGIREARK